MRNKPHYLVVGFMLCGILAVSGCTTIKKHPDFEQRHKSLKDVAIVMPDTDAFEVTFNADDQPLPETRDLIQGVSMDKLQDIFVQKGYEVKPVVYTVSDLDSDPGLRDAVFNLNEMYRRAILDIQKNKQKTFTYDISSSANYFADKHQVNALVLTRQVAKQLSDGVITAQTAQNTAAIATSILFGVGTPMDARPHYQLITEISVVDADLGDILWYHIGTSTKKYTEKEKPESIHQLLENILKEFPDSKFKSTVKKAVQKIAPINKSTLTPKNQTPLTAQSAAM